MAQRDRTWLGWPLWLVTAVLVIAALTGSAGPIQVIWALGTISVSVGVAWFYLRGWFGARRGDHRSEPQDPSRPRDGDRHPTGTDARPGSG